MKEWKLSIFNIVDKRIKFYSQNTNLLPPKTKSLFRHLKQGIQKPHRKYVLVPADKAANNVVIVCRLHYNNTLKQELNGTKAYEETSIDEKSVVYSHSNEIPNKFAVENMFWPIKNSCEVLSKLRDIGYQATSLSTPYRFSWTIFILGLALSYTDKLLVFRWVQIVLLL